jgi:hypothetical protein
MTKRFVTAASMSLPTPGTKLLGLQSVSNHTFVHGYV